MNIQYSTVIIAACLAMFARSRNQSPLREDHLIPVSFARYADSGSYVMPAYCDSLIDSKSPPDVWMLAEPAFWAEYALVIRASLPTEPTLPGKQYRVEYNFADPPVWSASDSTYPIRIGRMAALLPDSVALRLIAIWRSVVRETRKEKETSIGADGVTYIFFAEPNLLGQIWSPESGTMKKMVDSSDLLVEYVKGSPSEQSETLNQLLNLLEKIEARRIDSSGVNGN